jgi:hypothetical protein
MPVGGEIFRSRTDWPCGPLSLLYNGCPFFPGVKRQRREFNHPSPLYAEVQERVELYIYSPSEPSWPVIGEIYLHLYLLSTFFYPIVSKTIFITASHRYVGGVQENFTLLRIFQTGSGAHPLIASIPGFYPRGKAAEA